MPKLHRDSDGTFPSYAWPGGYPVIYICDDGGTLCPACANGQNGSGASPDSNDPSWRLIASDIHWEGPDEYCDHCGEAIPSAYGDPEEDRNNV